MMTDMEGAAFCVDTASGRRREVRPVQKYPNFEFLSSPSVFPSLWRSEIGMQKFAFYVSFKPSRNRPEVKH